MVMVSINGVVVVVVVFVFAFSSPPFRLVHCPIVFLLYLVNVLRSLG